MTTKVCTTCKEEKPVEKFNPDSRYKSGYRSQCDQCRYDRQWRVRLGGLLRNKYGITIDQYEEMNKQQQYVCAICFRSERRRNRKKNPLHVHRQDQPQRLAVDHDHNTGKVRGLLCQSCNTALGTLDHDVKLLQAAIDYLRKS